MRSLLFSCLVDFNHEPTIATSLALIKSIRALGGSLKGNDILICYVGEMTQDYRNEIAKHDNVTCKNVLKFTGNDPKKYIPPCNKLRIVQQEEIHNYDFLCILDCDTVVLDDISSFVQPHMVSAKMADELCVSPVKLQALFHYAGEIEPKREFKTTNGTYTVAYCNAGVIILDTRMSKFMKLWVDNTKWLLENPQVLGRTGFFTEQCSLSLSLYQYGIEAYAELPVTMNFPTTLKLPLKSVPKIAHYHSQFSGNKLTTPYQLINKRINPFLS